MKVLLTDPLADPGPTTLLLWREEYGSELKTIAGEPVATGFVAESDWEAVFTALARLRALCPDPRRRPGSGPNPAELAVRDLVRSTARRLARLRGRVPDRCRRSDGRPPRARDLEGDLRRPGPRPRGGRPGRRGGACVEGVRQRPRPGPPHQGRRRLGGTGSGRSSPDRTFRGGTGIHGREDDPPPLPGACRPTSVAAPPASMDVEAVGAAPTVVGGTLGADEDESP